MRASAHRLLFLGVSLALCTLLAVAIDVPTVTPAAPYTIRTSTGVELVDIANPLFNFTSHDWHNDDDVWTLNTPFPVFFYGVEYNELAVSSNGNIQFSQESAYQTTTGINEFPTEYLDGALMAMQADMRTDFYPTDDIRSAVIGEAPSRTLVIDWQGTFYSNDQRVHFQFHLHEDSLTVSIVYGAGCNFFTPLMDPEWDEPVHVGVQQYQNTGLSTRYEGDLEDSLRIDFDTKPFVGFTGIPSEPLRIPRSDNATLTLPRPARIAIIAPMEWTLTCVAPTAATLTFPLRLCPLEGAEPCTNATTVEFRSADYLADAEFLCTLTAAAPIDGVMLEAPFPVDILLPRLAFGQLPPRPLTVPTASHTLELFKSEGVQMTASINVTLTCTLADAPTLTFPFTLCVEDDAGCSPITSAEFQTNAQMPSGNYSCASTLGEGSIASPLYNLPTSFTIGVVRHLRYRLTQSVATLINTDTLTDHAWTAEYYYSPYQLGLPFPVRVFNGSYTKVAVGPYGNLLFSYAWGINDWTSNTPTDTLPSPWFGTTLFAYSAPMRVTAMRSGVVGQAPNRTFVIDVQHILTSGSGSVNVRVQYLLHELAVGSHLSVIYSGFPNVDQPWSNFKIAMALQSRDLDIADTFDGRLTGTMRIDYNQFGLQFSGVPTAPLRAPDGAAQLTLTTPDGMVITESTDFTLTCTSTTAPTSTHQLRLCAGCTSLTTVNFSAASVTEPITFNCTSAFVGLPALDYLLPIPVIVRLYPPVTITNAWTLTVSGPAPFPTRIFTDANAAQSPIELPIQAGPNAAAGADATALTHWMSGSNCHLNDNADANTPDSRSNALSWTGKDEQLYLFSGYGPTSFNADLWRYSPVNGQWTNLSMPDSWKSVHGVRGQSSNETTPGTREGSCVAVDNNGDAWIFGGGSNQGNVGDVFKYSVGSSEWTFMAGSEETHADSTIEQGHGVPIAGNYSGPGSRYQPSCTWSNGKLFIFGGQENSGSSRNDLWSYDPVTDQWTWINGDRAILPKSVKMMKTMAADTANTTVLPSPRYGAFVGADAQGKLWLVGGRSYDGAMVDVWSFDLASGTWVFEAGSQTPVAPYQAVYGRFRVPAASNVIPDREYFATAMNKRAGMIYISGGQGISSNLADVWSFNMTSKLFAWIGGTTAVGGAATGTYPAVKGLNGGELRVARPNIYGGNAWADASGGLWLGMGTHYNWELDQEQYCNDLWFMPSGAGVVTIDLAVAGIDSTVTSVAPALTHLGRNRWTLGRPELDGTAKDFNFTVVSGTGVAAAPFTLRLLQREYFVDNSWSATIAAPGLANSVMLTQASDTAAGIITLPATSALSTATITLTLPAGATVSPPATNGMLSVTIGATGTDTSLTFIVTAENRVAAAPFTITFKVSQSTDNSWNAAVNTPDLANPVALTQASDAAAGIITLPATSAMGTATITLTLPAGATVSPAAINDVLSVTLGAAGTNTSLTFTVTAENRVAAAPFTVTFVVVAQQPPTESSTGETNHDTSSSSGSNGPSASASSSTGSASSTSTSTSSSTGSASSTSSSTGSAKSSSTFKNAIVSMVVNYNHTTLPATFIADIKVGITGALRFPSKLGQDLQVVHAFVNRRTSSSSGRRRLLQTGSDVEVTQLTITFTPSDTRDEGAAKAAIAFSAQLRCLTTQCAADAAAAASVNSVHSSPELVALLNAIDPDSVDTIDGVTMPPSPGGADDSGLSDGAIAGIVVGVVVGVLLLLAGATFYMVRVRVRVRGPNATKASAKVHSSMSANQQELSQLPATNAA